MIIVNQLGDNITGSVNGKTFSVSYNEEKFALMKQLEAQAKSAATMDELSSIVEQFDPLTKESYKEIVETACPYLFVNKSTNKYFLKYNNKLSSIPIPQGLVDRILKSVEKKIDVTPLVKCIARFLRHELRDTPGFAKKFENFGKYISADYVNPVKKDELID